jgi:cell division protein FtsI (penicillin-binding protein 3)
VSSNVGAVQIAQRLGPERQFEMLERFGFGRSTESGFPSESAGLLRSWRSWKPVDQATVAFGQGIGVTPVQLAYATAALANDGERMRPRLTLARRESLGGWQPNPPVSAGQAIDSKTARRVLRMLESVVSAEGTGRLAALKGVRVAGKTGTAQLLDSETGSYSQTRYTAWFTGVVPADAPRLAIVVALDEPRGSAHTGGLVAAPLFAKVAATQLGHLGITTRPEPIAPAPPPTRLAEAREKPPAQPARPIVTKRIDPRPSRPAASAKVTSQPAAIRTPDVSARQSGNHLRSVLVPDFQGESIDSARRLAARESLDLRVVGSGRGLVVGQSPAPGTIVVGPDRTVKLSFQSGLGEG